MRRLPLVSIDKAVKSLAESEFVIPLAALLHGSRATNSYDDHSDVDLVVIVEEPIFRQSLQHIDGVHVDLLLGSVRSITSNLNKNYPDNNNFVLRATHFSRPIWGELDVAVPLKAVAAQLWETGPQAMTRKEVLRMMFVLNKMKAAVNTACRRIDGSPTSIALAVMQMDLSLVRSIYAHYRLERRWTTSFHGLVKELSRDYPPLSSIWVTYVSCSSPRDKQMLLLELMNDLLSKVQKRLALDKDN